MRHLRDRSRRGFAGNGIAGLKTLTLLRHAKSSWDDRVARDFDRPLNARGTRAARTMGTEMQRLGLAFDRVVASPAVRVRDTLAGVGAGYGPLPEPVFETRIYLASADTLLDIVQATSDAADRLLLVGHNPGLEDLVFLLVPDEDDDVERDKVEEKYPTAALAEIVFDTDSWTDAAAGTGRLVRFLRPRDLDAALGPDPNDP